MSSGEADLIAQVEKLLSSEPGDGKKLAQLSLLMSKHLVEQMDAVNSRLAKIETSLKVDEEAKKALIDWSWIRDKVMQPVMIAVLMWLLLTFVPTTLKGTP